MLHIDKMASGSVNFEKLNASNYSTWAFKMEMFLVKEDLWKYVESDEPDENSPDLRKYLEKSRKTLACIALMMEDDQAILLTNVKSGKMAWNLLKQHYQQPTISFKIRILKRLVKMQLEIGGNMQEHLNIIFTLVKELMDRGMNLEQQLVVSIILASLNEDYDPLVTAIEAWDESKLTIPAVKSKLIEEYERKKQGSGAEIALKMNSVGLNPKYGTECYYCGEKGHYKRNCPIRLAVLSSNNDNSHQNQVNKRSKKYYSCLSLINASTGEWFIDSGCTQHMTCDRIFFTHIDSKIDGKVEVASGQLLHVQGQGNVKLEIQPLHNNSLDLELTDVLYVPDLECNLISVRQLIAHGLQIVFCDDYCLIVDKDDIFPLAKCKNGLYRLEIKRRNNAKLCIHDWHRRLAHRNLQDIQVMKEQGLCVERCDCSDQCESCILGKMAKLPFDKVSTPVEKLLDVVVTDVCGPLSVEGLKHERYFITFTDLFSKFCTVYFMKTKDESKKYVKVFVERMKNLKKDKPKTIRSDRGGEYLDKELQEYLAMEGIKFECTVGYAPEQNGVSERKNRTLVEAARTLLVDSRIPKCFWPEAVHHSNYVFNRISSRRQNESPYERFYGKQPSLKEILDFGSYVYVKIPDVKRTKLDVKIEKMRYVGVDESSKGFRVADVARRTVKVSREVRFLEGSMNDKLTFYDDNEELSVRDENNVNENIVVNNFDVNNFCNEIDISDAVQNELTNENVVEEQIVVQEENDRMNTQENNNFDQDLQIQVRRSSRQNRGEMPVRFNDYYCYSAGDARKFYEPSTFEEAISCNEREKWYAAMLDELKSIENNETWILSELPENRRAVGCKWVYKLKYDEKGNVCQYKARLVAQGFSQKYGQDYDEVFAPVASSVSFRLLLSVAGVKGFQVKHFDVRSAFLNGVLEEDIYMRQPPGFSKGDQVLKLKKSIYGLKQAARVWNLALHRALLKCGCTQSTNDKCLYVLRKNNDVCYVLIHVDDLLLSSSTSELIDRVYQELSSSFELKNLGDVKQYLGINVTKDNQGHFCIDQRNYIERIVAEIGLKDSKVSSYPIDQGYFKNIDSPSLPSNDQYRKIIGMLLYLSTNSRPDVAASVSILSQKVSKPTVYDMNEAKRVVRYLKGSMDLKLHLSGEGVRKDLYAYADANFAEDVIHGKSNSGLFIGINGGALTWHCHKQQVVALSTTEAEYIALCEAGKELVWVKRLCKDFDIDVSTATPVYEDNQSCIKMILNDSQSNRTKHIRVKYHYTRDLVEAGEIRIVYCPTENNIADMLTKPLGPVRLSYLRKRAFMELHN